MEQLLISGRFISVDFPCAIVCGIGESRQAYDNLKLLPETHHFFPEAFSLCRRMETLPKEMLFSIFQNLHPLELVRLSRVNSQWYDVAMHPKLHRLF